MILLYVEVMIHTARQYEIWCKIIFGSSLPVHQIEIVVDEADCVFKVFAPDSVI